MKLTNAHARRRNGSGRVLVALALLSTFCTTVVAGVVAIAAPAGAQTCDTWTNSAGGSWDTGANWSGLAPPTGTTPACITAPGSYTVTIGNETISAGALTVGGTGSTPTLTIGNSGSGAANVTFASVINSGTIEPGLSATLTVPGAFTNTGTFEVPSSTSGGATLNLSALDNQGAFDVNQSSSLSLPTSSATMTNDSTGTLSVATGQTLTITSPSGQTGTVTQDGVIQNSGSVIVEDALSVAGGSICGNSPQIGIGGGSTGSLAFASTVGSGPSCGTGVATDNVHMANITGTLSGNIPAAYTVSIGDGGSGASHITIPSAMTIMGTLDVGFEGSLSATAAITNQGTLDAVSSAFSGQSFSFASFSNDGAFDINTPTTYSLPLSTSVLTNAATGTINVASGDSLTISSPSGVVGASVVQDGVIDNSGSLVVQDAVTINGGSICGNSVHIGGDAQASTIPSSLTFASTVTAGPSCGTGIETDNLFIANITGTLSGSIPKAYTVAIGDGGAGFAHVTIPAAMTISGTLDVGFEGALSSTAAITNKGTLDAVSSAFPGETFSLASFTNDGAFDIDTPTTYSLPKKTSTLVNGTKGTIAVSTSHSVTISSPSGVVGASVTQDGVIDNSGSISVQDALAVQGGSICGNTMNVGVDGQASTIPSSLTFATTVAAGPACGTGVATDNLFIANVTGTLGGTIPRGYTVAIGDGGSSFAHVTASSAKNLGTLEPGFGATVTFTKLKNKGTFEVPTSSFTTQINVTGNFTNKKVVVLDGNADLTLGSGASLVNSSATSSVSVGSASVQLTGGFTNNGLLAIAAGDTFAVSGSYAQASTGSYEPTLASTSSFGLLNVASTASLAGTLAPQDASGFTPPHGSTYLVLKSAGLGGTTFSTVSGSFTAQYLSGDNAQVTAD